jgi:GxxExxY protein
MSVHRKLGPGYRENTYQRDLEVQFTESGLTFEAQKLFEVYDSVDGSQLIGYYIPDFVVEDKIVVEIKALRGLDNSHLAQVIGYLAVGKYPIGLLINFGLRSLQYKRILPPKNVTEHRVNRQWLFVPDWLKPKLLIPKHNDDSMPNCSEQVFCRRTCLNGPLQIRLQKFSDKAGAHEARIIVRARHDAPLLRSS